MAWAALLKSAGSKAAMQSGKKMATNIAKEAAVNKVKSVVNKKKVKGKDIAKKMLGGGGESSEKGGALVIRPSSSIVSSPAGDLVPTKTDEGGSLVVKSKQADDLGLTPFIDSLNGVKDSVRSIKDALNDNSKDVSKRGEKQRLLNARLRKEEREEELESKKPALGIGKKIMKPAKDAAGNFLGKLLRFFKATLLGMFVNALVGGARDVVVAFIFGFKAYRMAKDSAVKFILGLKGKLGKGLSKVGTGLQKVGTSIGNFLGKVRSVLVGWIRNTVKGVQAAIKAAGKLGGKIAQSAGKFLQKTKPLQKVRNFIRNPGKNIQALQKSPVGKTVTNLIKNPGKTLQGGLKGLQKSNIGKGATNMLGGIKNWGAKKWKGAKELGGKAWKGISKLATNLQKKMMSGLDEMVKGGMETANKWGKNWNKFKDLATNPKKLLEVVKKALDSKVSKVLEKNKWIKDLKKLKDMKPKEIGKAISKFIQNLGKNKNFLKVTKGLQKAKALKIQGLDAVLAAILGIFDYVGGGESPINALLRASGSLIGYTMGAAAGLAIPVPGASFVTGMAGAWAGEKFADVIAAGLAETDMGTWPDEMQNDGRMWVRNPFTGKGEGERMDNLQEKQAELSENKKKDVSQDISSSASYEDDGTEELILIDGGGQQSSSIASLGGKPGLIPIGIGKDVNSEYEMVSNAALYKV